MFCPFRAISRGWPDTQGGALRLCRVALPWAAIVLARWAMNTDKDRTARKYHNDRTTRYGVAIDCDTVSKSFNSSKLQLEKMSSVVPTNRLACNDVRCSLLDG